MMDDFEGSRYAPLFTEHYYAAGSRVKTPQQASSDLLRELGRRIDDSEGIPDNVASEDEEDLTKSTLGSGEEDALWSTQIDHMMRRYAAPPHSFRKGEYEKGALVCRV
eukprot:TRINITY_DN11027_c0_g1_i1.p2 TRINITY_DN11027_c0_g1~~TRINITY_DN11027_c0_g1_i1.p2  ORF type:complete len:108 (+),score=16.29 TRINITY_DN11027_c0_g1_i1:541-864(+)